MENVIKNIGRVVVFLLILGLSSAQLVRSDQFDTSNIEIILPTSNKPEFIIKVWKVIGNKKHLWPGIKLTVTKSFTDYTLNKTTNFLGEANFSYQELLGEDSDFRERFNSSSFFVSARIDGKPLLTQFTIHESTFGNPARELLKDGNDLFKKKNYSEALINYKAAYKLYPHCAEALLGLANTHAETRQNYLSVISYRDYLSHSLSDPAKHWKVKEKIVKLVKDMEPRPFIPMEAVKEIEKAQIEAEAGNYLMALVYADKASNLAPWWREPYFLIGLLLYEPVAYKFQSRVEPHIGYYSPDASKNEKKKGDYRRLMYAYNITKSDAMFSLFTEARDNWNMYMELTGKGDKRNKIINEKNKQAKKVSNNIDPINDRSYLNQGDAFLEQRYFKRAIMSYTKKIEIINDYSHVYYSRGIAYKKMGLYEQAIRDLSVIVEGKKINPTIPKCSDHGGRVFTHVPGTISDPWYSNVFYALGLIYYDQGQYDKSLSEFNKAVHLGCAADAYYARGLVHAEMGQYKKAEKDYSKALKKKNNYAEVYFERGFMYFYQGKSEDAIKDFTNAVDIDKNNAEAFCYRGLIFSNLGKYREAIDDMNQAIKINQRYAQAYVYRAWIYKDLGKYDTAIKDLTKAVDTNSKDSWTLLAYSTLGRIYHRQGHYEKALNAYNKAIKLFPFQGDYFYDRGLIYQEIGDTNKALTDYYKAIEINSILIGPYNKILELTPNNNDILKKRGLAFYNRGKYGKAIQDISKALKVEPDDPGLNIFLAWLYTTCPESKYRNGSKAVKLALKAYELTEGKDPYYVDTLAAAYAEVGKFNKAIEYEKEAIGLAIKNNLNIEEFEKRLKLYQQGKAYNEYE